MLFMPDRGRTKRLLRNFRQRPAKCAGRRASGAKQFAPRPVDALHDTRRHEHAFPGQPIALADDHIGDRPSQPVDDKILDLSGVAVEGSRH
jgi:hypothetical protein